MGVVQAYLPSHSSIKVKVTKPYLLKYEIEKNDEKSPYIKMLTSRRTEEEINYISQNKDDFNLSS